MEIVLYQFKLREKNALKWDDLLKHLKESNITGDFVQEKEYRARVIELTKACPMWLNFVSLPTGGAIIKQMQKGVQSNELQRMIRAHFDK